MSVKGKKEDDWVAKTVCDFGEVGREETLTHHYYLSTAFRAYRKHWDIYHKIHGWKVWIELRKQKGIKQA